MEKICYLVDSTSSIAVSCARMRARIGWLLGAVSVMLMNMCIGVGASELFELASAIALNTTPYSLLRPLSASGTTYTCTDVLTGIATNKDKEFFCKSRTRTAVSRCAPSNLVDFAAYQKSVQEMVLSVTYDSCLSAVAALCENVRGLSPFNASSAESVRESLMDECCDPHDNCMVESHCTYFDPLKNVECCENCWKIYWMCVSDETKDVAKSRCKRENCNVERPCWGVQGLDLQTAGGSINRPSMRVLVTTVGLACLLARGLPMHTPR